MEERVHLPWHRPRPPDGRLLAPGLDRFPDDIVGQAAARLRILALLYASMFFLANFLPEMLSPTNRARFLSTFNQWGPGAISIALALVVAAVIRRQAVCAVDDDEHRRGLEIASSYGIAAAEFADRGRSTPIAACSGCPGWPCGSCSSPSSCPPRPAGRVLAALASVSSVPVTIGLVRRLGQHVTAPLVR
jgi:hypothetical protein